MKILKISLTNIQENHKETHINGEKRLGTLNPLLKPLCADGDDCKHFLIIAYYTCNDWEDWDKPAFKTVLEH